MAAADFLVVVVDPMLVRGSDQREGFRVRHAEI